MTIKQAIDNFFTPVNQFLTQNYHMIQLIASFTVLEIIMFWWIIVFMFLIPSATEIEIPKKTWIITWIIFWSLTILNAIEIFNI